MHYSSNSCRRLVIAWAAIGLFASLVPAQETPPKSSPPGSDVIAKPGNVSDPTDLEAFFDGAILVQMESKHIAGAVVAVVAGDKLVFSKGYGYADLAERQRVDPNQTMFRIASISKLFTWTAVMQQYEEGKLDLDADVNQYLKDVQIPSTFEQPITLKHLLTHTPGFDDYVIGLFSHSADGVHPLAQVLKEQMPTRVRPPGVIPSYSNHGTALAGLAVADVSGLSWEDYVEQRILKPLGMKHTLVRQPVADQLPTEISKGYKWEDGRFKAQDFEYIPAAPAGCISASAADMAQFMLAHLHDGQFGAAHILKPETARLMHSPLYRPDPKTSAMCYGFWEQPRNSQRVLGHGGDTMWFHSLLQIIPERGVGLFFSYNTDTSAGQRETLFNAFMQRYFPVADPARIQAGDGFAERAKRLTGEYGSTRYSHTTITKLSALFGGSKITANDDDTLTLTNALGSRRFVEVEPLVFRELDGSREVVFQEDKNGNIAYLFPADLPAVSSVRRQWYELQDVQVGVLVGCTAIFTSALLFWPALAFTVRGSEHPRIKRNWGSGLLSLLAWLSCLVSLGFVAGFAYLINDSEKIAFGLTPTVKMVLAMTQVCAVLAALTLIGCLIAWRNRYWRFTGRVHYTVVALAGVGFVAWLYYWNLLTFGFRDILS
jgi:CubicO group peptidase (beta-lactamase class C family)